MKLSSKARYGVQALFHMAFHAPGTSVQLREIAEQQQISLRFLEQVFRDLKVAGLVLSRRGPKGGYELAAAPEAIRLGEILRVLDGPVSLTVGNLAQDASTSLQVTDAIFGEVAAELERGLDRITLHDLCERARAMGVGAAPRAAYNYAI